MTTLYGGPMPPDFTDGEQLTAAGFNAVKNYWVVVGELPEEAEDGDVVFVVGEAAGGKNELQGVGAWTHITEVENPTNDIDPYEADGVVWKAYSWENPKVMSAGPTQNATRDLIGSITLAENGLVEVLIVAGGGSGYSNAGGGGAGGVIATVVELLAGKNDIYVGSGGQSTGTGGGSAVGIVGIGGGSYRSSGNSGNGFTGGSATTPGAGAAGNTYFNYDPDYNDFAPGPGITLNWADGVTDVVYGFGGDRSTSGQQPPGFGWGGTYQPTTNTGIYNPGANGFVLVRVPLEFANSVSVTGMSNETKKRAEKEAKFAEEQERNQPVLEGEDQ